jgi:cell division protein FtsL
VADNNNEEPEMMTKAEVKQSLSKTITMNRIVFLGIWVMLVVCIIYLVYENIHLANVQKELISSYNSCISLVQQLSNSTTYKI